MNIFPRKAKGTPNSYYFGEFDDKPVAPFSISVASFDERFAGEKKHVHSRNQKAYVTLEGEGVLNVDGREVVMEPTSLIHVEPSEVHFVARVTKAPLKFVVILSSKINDKTVVE